MSSSKNAEVWKSAEVASDYLQGTRGAIPMASEQVEVMLRLIDACAVPLHRFLDLGCGDGFLAGFITRQHPLATGVLLDFSEPMLEAARAKLSQPNLHFVQADYARPGWAETVRPFAPFEAIVSGFSIHHQPNARKQSLYAELFELLAPGGIFINVEHVSSPTPWVRGLYEEYFIDALYEYQLQHEDPPRTRQQVAEDFRNHASGGANILAPLDTQCAWLRDIGYVDVDCYFKVFEFAVFGGRRGPTQA